MEKIIKALNIEDLLNLTKKVGSNTLKYHRSQDLKIINKPDDTPVTAADLEAHNMIEKYLSQKYSFKIISEESHDVKSLSKEILPDTFWLIDPIDGTKDFIAGTGDYTINIALIYNKQPLLGIVYAPYHGELFYAIKGQGAFYQKNDDSITTIEASKTHNDSLRILVSSRAKEEVIEKIKKNRFVYDVTKMGSSLKYCKIAQGKADAYIRFKPTSEWDTAAAQCVLEEAGGSLTDHSNKTLAYGKNNLLNSSIVALGNPKIDFLNLLMIKK